MKSAPLFLQARGRGAEDEGRIASKPVLGTEASVAGFRQGVVVL